MTENFPFLIASEDAKNLKINFLGSKTREFDYCGNFAKISLTPSMCQASSSLPSSVAPAFGNSWCYRPTSDGPEWWAKGSTPCSTCKPCNRTQISAARLVDYRRWLCIADTEFEKLLPLFRSAILRLSHSQRWTHLNRKSRVRPARRSSKVFWAANSWYYLKSPNVSFFWTDLA